MPVKVTFFFRYGTQGWSESFYRNSVISAAEAVVMDNYINKRMKLAATEVTLLSVRMSDVDSARDVTIFPILINGVDGSWVFDASGGTAPNQTAQALLIRLSDGAQHYRTFNLLGLPDHVIFDNQVDPGEEAILTGRLNEWISAITTAGFTMRINSAPVVTGTISGFGAQTDAAPLVKIQTSGPLPVKDSLVQITSSLPFKMLNRMWRVASSGAGQFALARSKSLQAFGEVEGGKYRVPVYTYVTISTYTVSRVSVRKTGIVFGQQRGRRSSRV